MMNNKLLFQVSAEDFKMIPGCPIAYWGGDRIGSIFQKSSSLINLARPCQGMATTNNALFVRNWQEVDFLKVGLCCLSESHAFLSQKKWFPYNKGGEFRKWYGNASFVVNYENKGKTICDYIDNTPNVKVKSNGRVINRERFFKESISWSKISSGNIAIRFFPEGFIFDVAGCSIFSSHNDLVLFLALLNSKICRHILSLLSPTLNFEVGQINIFPVLYHELLGRDNIRCNCEELIHFEQNDWDSYETSWDFQENPLIDAGRHNDKSKMLSDLYGQVRVSWEQKCETMRKLEVENNRIFIELYGLQDELSPEVPWNEITLTSNPWYRYGKSPELESDGQHFSTTGELKVGTIFGMQPTGIKVSEPNQEMKVTSFPFNQELEDRLQKDTVKELISYAVGCMFGRYSLDLPGLAFAGGEWESTNYMTFQPDADNVIPILDEDWFADDIVGRFQEFLKVAFGEENFHENLTFIEAALGKDIRSYFTKDFYADHVKMYQKRPIYWLFSSPTGAFSALVYLHRYRQDTVGTVLTYLRSHITKVNAHIQEQEEIIASAKASASMKSKAVRERLKMQHELQELEDYERDVLYPLSTERLEIDLDDGVKVNYPKFGKALRPVKGLDAKEE